MGNIILFFTKGISGYYWGIINKEDIIDTGELIWSLEMRLIRTRNIPASETSCRLTTKKGGPFSSQQEPKFT